MPKLLPRGQLDRLTVRRREPRRGRVLTELSGRNELHHRRQQAETRKGRRRHIVFISVWKLQHRGQHPIHPAIASQRRQRRRHIDVFENQRRINQLDALESQQLRLHVSAIDLESAYLAGISESSLLRVVEVYIHRDDSRYGTARGP